ncbi:MAG: hypothetical protein JOZ14_01260 [Acidobacteria bacterium]|nr:hypothetical protein [Acidobacteriota bacterium]
MAESHQPTQFTDAAKEAKESLDGHQKDLADMQSAAVDASEDLEMRKSKQLRASRDVKKRKEDHALRTSRASEREREKDRKPAR